jgi:hypothetical protein
MKSTIIAFAVSVVALPALAQSTHSDPVFKNFNDLKWEKTNPELGDNSQEIAILHVNPTTKATELFSPEIGLVGRAKPDYNHSVQIYGQYCPVARAAELLADRWTVLIVRELLADILISMTSSAAFLGFRARF